MSKMTRFGVVLALLMMVSMGGSPWVMGQGCQECKGGVISLTLRYNGDAAADIVVEAGDVVYDVGVVNPGDEFTLDGTRDDGKFENNNLVVFIDGEEQGREIHVSCSQPIGPGAVFGDLEVVAAVSKDNGNVCPVPDCQECKGGVIRLTLRYNGDAAADIVIEAGDVSYDVGVVNPGDEFTLDGTRDDGKFENNNLVVFIDGEEQAREIHVSCSQPIGPGAVFGDLEVVVAVSKDNGNVCPVPDCLECDGGVIRLTLRYNGDAAADIVVEAGDVSYDVGVVNPGDEFTLEGTRDDGKFDDNNLVVFIDGEEQAREIHVSCSQPIGPGAVFGDLEVVAAVSKDNGNVCPVPDCLECKGGVIRLTLRYNGDAAADIVVEAGDVVYDVGVVNPGDEFTLEGTRDDGKFENNNLVVFIDGEEQAREIHVSCSQPIGPGAVFGDLEVVAAVSKDNGNVCPVPDCLECKGGVISLTLRYNGDAAADIVVEAGDVSYDVGVVNPGDEFTLEGTRDDGKFDDNNLVVFIDGEEQAREIHVSCSQPIGPGAVFGDLEVVAAMSKDNGNVCPVPDCLECDGGVTRLTLRYDGLAQASVQILDSEEIYFDGTVQPGDTITVDGTRDDGKFQKNDLGVLVDGLLDTTIHVSCSKPIEPGLFFGSFLVVDAISRDGGRVCPFCEADLGPPVISYRIADLAGTTATVAIVVTDDLALQGVDLSLQAFEIDFGAPDLIGAEIAPADPRFPIVLSNTFAPGAKEAILEVGIDTTINSLFRVTAEDLCGNVPCATDSTPPSFLDVLGGDADGDGIGDVSVRVVDETGLVSLEVLLIDNACVDPDIDMEDDCIPKPFVPGQTVLQDFVPGTTESNFLVELVNPGVGGTYGALAADQCNAFAFDFPVN